jgi:hypothetical protein
VKVQWLQWWNSSSLRREALRFPKSPFSDKANEAWLNKAAFWPGVSFQSLLIISTPLLGMCSLRKYFCKPTDQPPILPHRCRRTPRGWADSAATCASPRRGCVRGVFFSSIYFSEATSPPPMPPYRCRYTQDCHNGRFWVKMTVRTSADVRVYSADAVLPADRFLPFTDAFTCPCGHGSPRMWARVDLRPRMDTRLTNAALGVVETFRISTIKGELSPFSLTSNQSRLNSWGLKRCITLRFFPTGSLGFWLGVHYRRGGEVLMFCRIFRSCWFEDVGSGGYLGGSEGKINFKG